VEHGIVKSHTLARCPACGFVQTTTVVGGQPADFYERDYFEGQLAHG
jgi:uncharacterized Zn finger protein